MMMAAKYLLPCSLLITGLMWSIETCNVTFFSTCIGLEVNDLHDRFEIEPVFPVYDNSTFDHICTRLTSENASQCAEKSRSSCFDSSETIMFNGTVDVIEYMCAKNIFGGYMEHRECFNRQTVVFNGTKCMNTYSLQLASVRTLQDVGLCSSIDTLIECIREIVGFECGVAAAQWIHEAKRISLQPIKQFINCDETGWDKTMGVVILFSFTFLSLTVIATLLCRFFKSHRNVTSTVIATYAVKENNAILKAPEAAALTFTHSSDLKCCGHVTVLMRDDHKPRPSHDD